MLPASAIGAAIGAALLLAGCSSMMGGELIRPGEPVGQLRVTNGSGTTITQVLISECDAMSYGMNRMPGGMVLQPGQSWTVSVSAGCYDIMMGYGTATGYAAATQRLRVNPGRLTGFTATGR
jgi:hypothetical protein